MLRRPGASNGDRFGAALAVVDGTLVIGAPGVGKVYRLQADQVAELSLPAARHEPWNLAGARRPAAGCWSAPRAEPKASCCSSIVREQTTEFMVDATSDSMGRAGRGRVAVFIGAPRDDTGSVDGGAVFMYLGAPADADDRVAQA